jgi:hypothetical protein
VLEEDDMTSDHLTFRIELRLNNINQNENDKRSSSRKKYNILKANWSEFQSFLPKVMDSELIDIDEMNEVVINGIISAANLEIPVYSNNKKVNKSLPKYILNLIKARKLARKAKKRKEWRNSKKTLQSTN